MFEKFPNENFKSRNKALQIVTGRVETHHYVLWAHSASSPNAFIFISSHAHLKIPASTKFFLYASMLHSLSIPTILSTWYVLPLQIHPLPLPKQTPTQAQIVLPLQWIPFSYPPFFMLLSNYPHYYHYYI